MGHSGPGRLGPLGTKGPDGTPEHAAAQAEKALRWMEAEIPKRAKKERREKRRDRLFAVFLFFLIMGIASWPIFQLALLTHRAFD